MSKERKPRWCERCQKFHPWSPPFNPEEHINRAVKELADTIDAEVLGELLNKHALRKTDP